ncbi:uncharacterized protein LOC143545893 [Bidens hawaiensis]|uniref:uncharacterized protein LOC143545893 n=1 Tax=Bidens hawaiensis TaxID=980011 RepID=UPI0040491F9F
MAVDGDAHLWDEIVTICHESPMGGHPGVWATVQRVKGLFLEGSFKDGATDCGLLKVRGKDTIFVVVDRLKKYSHFMVLGHPFSAKEVAHLQGVSAKLSTAYHSQNDGKTEVVNRCLEGYLRCIVMERPHTRVKWVSLTEWWYNTTFHSSLGKFPFEALYGYCPPLHIPYIPIDITDKEVDEMMQDREAAVRVLKQMLLKAQNCMKQQADRHHTKR